MTYTPTTDELDTDWLQEVYVSSENYYADEPRAELRSKFNRWLAEERAKVWDEAIAYVSPDDVEIMWAANPYREETP